MYISAYDNLRIAMPQEEEIMNRLITFMLVTICCLTFTDTSIAQETIVVIKGSSWDSDSHGFAFQAGLSKQRDTITAARRGSRISVDGRPDVYAISREGGKFELTLTSAQPTFRLIVEGDRFPRAITQPFTIPDGGGELDVGRVYSPRAEGTEHTWPLPIVATALGYVSSSEMLADNKAAIRLLTFGSGAEGAPYLTSGAKITFTNSSDKSSSAELTTTSPFLMRVPKSEYLIPFWMTHQDTYIEPVETANGAYIIIVSFEPDDPVDKDVIIQIEDTVTNELLDPPRPWKFGPRIVSVRNGFATEFWTFPDITGGPIKNRH
jgi:hypothetical protein